MPNRIPDTRPAAPARPAPTAAPATSVTVKSGDTLSGIASRNGTTVKAMVEANKAKYPTLATNAGAIQIGWKLKLPGAAPEAPATRPPGWNAGNTPTTTRPTGTTVRPNDFGAKVAAGGAQSIEMRMTGHQTAIERTGIGTYFGDHSEWKSMSAAERKAWVAENKKPGTTPTEPKESSCIGWAMENVGAAYAAAGKSERWAQIMKTVVAKGSKGTDLAIELKKDGWESVYWNPDTKKPDDGNNEHPYTASLVKSGKPYYGIAVDHQVTNYRPTEGSGTAKDMSGIEKLKKVPFFFGLARGGTHTFVGRQGKVNEFHWSDMPNSKHAIEESALQKFMWNSGVIMVPPGTWPKD